MSDLSDTRGLKAYRIVPDHHMIPVVVLAPAMKTAFMLAGTKGKGSDDSGTGTALRDDVENCSETRST